MLHPLIVTAEFAAPDFACLEGLRRAHYPPERNQVPAHLTLFHALPPSLAAEAKAQLAAHARGIPPRANITGLMDLGGGSTFAFAYVARAVTPGEFFLPGAQAVDMYHPAVAGRTAASRLVVAAGP